jgi:hypothetical protein
LLACAVPLCLAAQRNACPFPESCYAKPSNASINAPVPFSSHDLVQGALFYEQQREGLGDYFTDRLFEDLDQLESEAGIHAIVYGLHRKIVEEVPVCYLLQS